MGLKRAVSFHRMENFYGCPYDFIEIFDGPPSESFSLGKFCSGITPVFVSSANRMRVVFHSDAIITNSGFHASYESLVQDENDTGRSLIISVPSQGRELDGQLRRVETGDPQGGLSCSLGVMWLRVLG